MNPHHPADAVGLFEELWSFLQKILLKEMWLTPGQVLK